LRYPEEILRPLISLPEGEGECWKWTGKIHKTTGYGNKTLGGKTVLAHRWVYTIFNGYITDGMVIDHKCGVRSCVNPSHLEEVTQQENCRRGAGTKLTQNQAREIKTALQNIEWGGRGRLAKKYNVSAALISDIKYGRAWADIKPSPKTSDKE